MELYSVKRIRSGRNRKSVIKFYKEPDPVDENVAPANTPARAKMLSSYSVEDRLVYDGDEIYIKTYQPYGNDDDLADHLSRTTFAHSAKGFPRGPPARPMRKIKIITKDYPFRDVSKSELESITDRLCKPTFSAQMRNSRQGHEPQDEECDFEKKFTPRPLKGILKKGAEKRASSGKKSARKGRVIIKREGFEYSTDEESYSSDESESKSISVTSEVSARSERKEEPQGKSEDTGTEEYASDFEPDTDDTATDRDRTPTPTRGVSDSRRGSRDSKASRVTSIPASESTLTLSTEDGEDRTPVPSPRDKRKRDSVSSRDDVSVTSQQRSRGAERRNSIVSDTSDVSSASLTESEASHKTADSRRSGQSAASRSTVASRSTAGGSSVSYRMSREERKTPSVHSSGSFRPAGESKESKEGDSYKEWANARAGPGQSPRPSVRGSQASLPRAEERSRSPQRGAAPVPGRSSSPDRSRGQTRRDQSPRRGSVTSFSPSQRVGNNARPISSQSAYSQNSSRQSRSPSRSTVTSSRSGSPQRSASYQSMQSASVAYASRSKSGSRISLEDEERSGVKRSRASLDAFSNAKLKSSRDSVAGSDVSGRKRSASSPRPASVSSNRSSRSSRATRSTTASKRKQKGEFLRYIMDEYE